MTYKDLITREDLPFSGTVKNSPLRKAPAKTTKTPAKKKKPKK